MSASMEQRELLAMVTESWVENLYEDWRSGGDVWSESEYDAICNTDGPAAVAALRDAERPEELALGGKPFDVVAEALWGVVMDEDGYDNYDEIFEVDRGQIKAAAEALGLTREYYEAREP